MRFLILLITSVSFQNGMAQRVVDVTKEDVRVGSNYFFVAGGEPFLTAKFVNLKEGTPYFKDEWLKAILINEDNEEYRSVDVKLDLLDNKIHYLDPNGKEFISTTLIKQVIFTDASGFNYKFVHSSILPKGTNTEKNGWYLWLTTGTASLYKFFTKSLSEVKPYGSATFEQRIKTSESYLVHYNNTFLEIKKIKDAPSVLANKKSELQDFLKNKDNPNSSPDERFTSLIEFYNTLFKAQK